MILEEDCVLVKLDQDIISHCKKFECGNEDLDEFFDLLRTRMLYFDLKD